MSSHANEGVSRQVSNEDDSESTLAGLWQRNPVLMQMLGLCPLLAVSTSVVSGFVLGLATLLALGASSTCVSALRKWLPAELRLPAFVTIVATMVTLVDLLLMTYAHALHRQIGLFIPLIVTNCAVLARIEAFAYRKPVRSSAIDGLVMGAGFALVLLVLGALRELVGRGSLFADAELLFGAAAATWQLNVFDASDGLLLAVLPPGAFFGLALLAVCSNALGRSAGQAG